MGINYSQETSKSIIEEYEFRVKALLKKIEDLEKPNSVKEQYEFKIKSLLEKIEFLEANIQVLINN